MRWRTRRAVCRLVDQIGSSTAMTFAVVMAFHALARELRHGVVAQGRAPLTLVLAALPVLGMDGDHRLARLREGRRALHAPPGVAPLGDCAGVVERPLARHGERDDGIAAEADAGGPAVGPDGLRPGLGEVAADVALDEEAQAVAAVAVAVAAGGTDGFDEGGGQPPGSIFSWWNPYRVTRFVT